MKKVEKRKKRNKKHYFFGFFALFFLLTALFVARLPKLSSEKATFQAIVTKSLLSYQGKSPDKKVKVVITAYTSTVDQCDANPFVGASGKEVYEGMVAANWLPFGTKVMFPSLFGNKIFTVDDRMNPDHGGYGRMDIWMNTPRSEAIQFGVKRAEALIFYPEKQITAH